MHHRPDRECTFWKQPPPSLLDPPPVPCPSHPLMTVTIVIVTTVTLQPQRWRRIKGRWEGVSFFFWVFISVASCMHWSEQRDMAPCSYKGGREMWSLLCDLLNFSTNDREKEYWKTSRVSPRVLRKRSPGGLLMGFKKSISSGASSCRMCSPSRSWKKDVMRVTGNTPRTSKWKVWHGEEGTQYGHLADSPISMEWNQTPITCAEVVCGCSWEGAHLYPWTWSQKK